MTIKLVVGYKVRPALPPEQVQALNIVPPDGACPYLTTFEKVTIVHPATTPTDGAVKTFSWEPPEKGSPTVSARVWAWLAKSFKDAWPDDTHPGDRPPRVAFVGFDPDAFARLLAAECSTDPAVKRKVPLLVWWGRTGHLDVGPMVRPGDLPWSFVLACRGVGGMVGWEGPGADADADALVAADLALQMGLLSKPR